FGQAPAPVANMPATSSHCTTSSQRAMRFMCESRVMIRAVLFDVGGPLNTEETHERLFDEHIRAELAGAGFAVTDAAYADAARWAVDSFAANTYQAIIWRLTGQQAGVAEQVYRAVAQHP